MDRRLVIGATAGAFVLAAAMFVLTRTVGTLAGYMTAMGLYWLALLVALFFFANRTALAPLWRLGRVDPLSLGLAVIPAALIGVMGLNTFLTGNAPLWTLVVVVLFAAINGTLEEAFWRGAILPQPGGWATWGAVSLFGAYHLAYLASAGIDLSGGALLFVIAAAALGGLWMIVRLRTGGLFLSILGHIGVNLGTFGDLFGVNWPTPCCPV
jgi:membrane protease YdiL (CAAX protease family)